MIRLGSLTGMPRKKLCYGLAAVALGICVIGGIVVNNQPMDKSQDIPVVRTAVISMQGTTREHTYSGEVRGRVESQLAFQVGGKIIRRNVDLGNRVRAGEALMQIDPKDIQQTVNISSAQAYSAESQLRLAENNLARYRKLYEQNAVSRMQYEQYQSAYDAALAAVRQASAQYAQGANQLDYSTLYAEADGVIASVDAEAGQVVAAGQSVATLVRDGELEVEISVPENRIDEVRKAGPVSVAFWALPDIAVAGKVREVSPIADKVTRTYKVRITLAQALPEIRLGMTATVTVAGAGRQAPAFVPLAAVYQEKDTPSVWVVTDGVVNLRPVKLGQYGDAKVQVLSGIKAGDTIVTAGVHKLREGQKVRTTDGGGQ